MSCVHHIFNFCFKHTGIKHGQQLGSIVHATEQEQIDRKEGGPLRSVRIDVADLKDRKCFGDRR